MTDSLPVLRGADLALLGSLDVLLDEANVTRAAARLHLSQPALSAQLARLRELTGDPLLVPARNGRGMTPTARAMAIREPLRAALQGVQAALARGVGFDPAHDARTFHVIASDNGFVMAGVDLVKRVAQRAPNVRLAFRSVPADQAGAWLENGSADLLIAADFAIPAGTTTRALLRERYVMAQRKGHPRGLAPPDLDAYCALDHVIVSSDGGGFHGFMDDALARRGRTRRVTMSVQQYHLAPLALEATDCVCALPERFLQRFDDRLDLLPLPVEVGGFGLNAAWHPRDEANAAHRWLREQLFRALATAGGHADAQPGTASSTIDGTPAPPPPRKPA